MWAGFVFLFYVLRVVSVVIATSIVICAIFVGPPVFAAMAFGYFFAPDEQMASFIVLVVSVGWVAALATIIEHQRARSPPAR